jgi:hypothetical protein
MLPCNLTSQACTELPLFRVTLVRLSVLVDIYEAYLRLQVSQAAMWRSGGLIGSRPLFGASATVGELLAPSASVRGLYVACTLLRQRKCVSIKSPLATGAARCTALLQVCVMVGHLGISMRPISAGWGTAAAAKRTLDWI